MNNTSLRTGIASLAASALLAVSLVVLAGCSESGNSNQPPARVNLPDIVEDRGTNIDGSNEAVLLMFYMDDNEVSHEQMEVLERVAAGYVGRVKVVKVDCVYETKYSSNAALVTFYDVHNVPAFVLRRKGDVYYHKHVGRLDEQQLKRWIDRGLTFEPAPEPESR